MTTTRTITLHGQKIVLKEPGYPNGWFESHYKDFVAELPKEVRRLFGGYYDIR